MCFVLLYDVHAYIYNSVDGFTWSYEQSLCILTFKGFPGPQGAQGQIGSPGLKVRQAKKISLTYCINCKNTYGYGFIYWRGFKVAR